MPARLSWHEGYTDRVDSAEVASADDLDRLIDRLTARAAELGTPFNVTVAGVYGSSMDIVVGAAVASVQWVPEDPWTCQVSISGETADDDDVIQFVGNGQHSELPRRWWIAVSLAREAVRHYFHTGHVWEFPDFSARELTVHGGCGSSCATASSKMVP